MKVPFYLLGMLIRFGRQHGYRLKESIEKSVADFANIKLPTIYYHLEKLSEQGYVTSSVERCGNRPEKRVYEITPSGRKHFEVLSREIMQKEYITEFDLDAVLFFNNLIDKNLLIKSLEDKKKRLEKKIQYAHEHQNAVLQHIPEGFVFWAETIFDHHICHMEAELEWAKRLMDRIGK